MVLVLLEAAVGFDTGNTVGLEAGRGLPIGGNGWRTGGETQGLRVVCYVEAGIGRRGWLSREQTVSYLVTTCEIGLGRLATDAHSVQAATEAV